MTERLSQLLHEAADELPVPPPPAELVLARGRRERRRRTTLTGLAAAAALAVVGGSVALAAGGVGGPDAIDPATPPGTGAVYSVDGTVLLGDDVTVRVPGTVHSFHYTTDGVLVRSNQAGGASDGSGPEDLTFVDPDGSTNELGRYPEGWGPATDPGSPLFALAELRDGTVTVVLRDAATGESTDRIRVPGSYTRMPWPVPPLSMSDDTVYVPMDDAVLTVDTETGEVGRAPHLEPGQVPEVVAGLQTSYAGRDGIATLTDVATGEVVLQADTGEHGHLDVSPDGRYAMAVREPTGPEDEDDGVTVHTVATGETATLPGAPWDLGWTADGQLFSVDAEHDTVTTCDPATGACQEASADLPDVQKEEGPAPVTPCTKDGCMTEGTIGGTPPELRLGGRSYES